MTLDAPAKMDGQRVFLPVNDSNLSNIMGQGYFDIPACESQGARISWLLGTRRVLTKRKLSIAAEVNGCKAHTEVELTKE